MPLENLNISLFNLLNAPANASAAVVSLALFLANYLIFLIPLFLAGQWLWGRKEAALNSFIVVLVSLGLGQILVRLVPHPRPFMIGLGRQLMEHAPDASFPSDHMIVFAGVAFVFLLKLSLFEGFAVLALGLLVGWSRIYLGVHFPFDVLGSLVVTLSVSLCLLPCKGFIQKTVFQVCLRIYRVVFRWPIELGWVK